MNLILKAPWAPGGYCMQGLQSVVLSDLSLSSMGVKTEGANKKGFLLLLWATELAANERDRFLIRKAPAASQAKLWLKSAIHCFRNSLDFQTVQLEDTSSPALWALPLWLAATCQALSLLIQQMPWDGNYLFLWCLQQCVPGFHSDCCKTPSDSNNQIILSLLHGHLRRLSHRCTAVKQCMGFSPSLPP